MVFGARREHSTPVGRRGELAVSDALENRSDEGAKIPSPQRLGKRRRRGLTRFRRDSRDGTLWVIWAARQALDAF